MFGKKLNSDEYEKLRKELIEVKASCEELKTKVEVLRSNINSLRGLVNRKGYTEKEQETDTENIKYKDFLP